MVTDGSPLRAFTVSNSMLTQVRNYIKNQEEHHRKMNFEEEMLFFEKQIFSPNPVNPWRRVCKPYAMD
jgi:hypothetical protein